LVLVSACNLANPEPPQIQELTGEPTITLTLIPTVNLTPSSTPTLTLTSTVTETPTMSHSESEVNNRVSTLEAESTNAWSTANAASTNEASSNTFAQQTQAWLNQTQDAMNVSIEGTNVAQATEVSEVEMLANLALTQNSYQETQAVAQATGVANIQSDNDVQSTQIIFVATEVNNVQNQSIDLQLTVDAQQLDIERNTFFQTLWSQPEIIFPSLSPIDDWQGRDMFMITPWSVENGYGIIEPGIYIFDLRNQAFGDFRSIRSPIDMIIPTVCGYQVRFKDHGGNQVSFEILRDSRVVRSGNLFSEVNSLFNVRPASYYPSVGTIIRIYFAGTGSNNWILGHPSCTEQ
jgi:hypothetical protein